MSAWRYEQRQSAVDGVPVVWADTPGPLAAGLVFRTGAIDEPLPCSGWTHAVEHLAFARLDPRYPRVNAQVELLFTRFFIRDEPETVVRFLRELCLSLHDLDPGRIETERRVLAVEAQRHTADDAGRMLWARYGHAGPGRVAQEPWGLPAMTPDRLAAWSAGRFTRDNAALWLSGPPPDGLRVPLPPGQRLAPPVAAPVVPAGPHAVVDASLDAAALLFVTGRGHSADVTGAVLAARLRERLRRQEGVTYSARVVVAPLNADQSYVLASADSVREDHHRVARSVTEIVTDLAQSPPTAEEVSSATRRDADVGRDPRLADTLLDTAAADVLLGAPDRARHPADPVEVTPDEVRSALATASGTWLLGVKYEGAREATGWPAVPGWSAALPGGALLYRGEDEATRRRLVVTDDGVGLHVGPDEFVTVRWRDCVGVVSWDDGTRVVVGVDGFAVRVVPAHWPGGEGLAALVDAHVPPHLGAPQGPGLPDDGEQEWREANTPPFARKLRARKGIRASVPVVLVVFLVCVAVLGVVGAVVGLLYLAFGTRVLSVVVFLVIGLVIGGFSFARRLAKGENADRATD